MANIKTDKTKCRTCKLQSPAVTIALKHGKPIGQCLDCKRNYEVQARLTRNFHLNLYKAMPELVSVNLKLIGTLQNGCYYLHLATNKAQVGYIIVQNSEIFVNLHNRSDLFYRDYVAIASYLGNSGVCIDPKGIPATDVAMAAAIDSNPFDAMPVTDAQERIIWLDKGLIMRCMRLLESTAKQAKTANIAIARSKNPKAMA